MRENVGSQGFWWYLGRRVHDLRRLSRDLVPNSGNKARSPENFIFKSLLSEKHQAGCFFGPWETSATKLDQCESSWKKLRENHFRLNFQLRLQGKKRVHSPKRIFWDGVSTYMFPNHGKNRSKNSVFTEFLFLQNCDISKLPIDSYRASPCDLGFSAILLLHYGWIEVEGVWCVKIVWMIKKAYFWWKWTPKFFPWLSHLQSYRNPIGKDQTFQSHHGFQGVNSLLNFKG